MNKIAIATNALFTAQIMNEMGVEGLTMIKEYQIPDFRIKAEEMDFLKCGSHESYVYPSWKQHPEYVNRYLGKCRDYCNHAKDNETKATKKAAGLIFAKLVNDKDLQARIVKWGVLWKKVRNLNIGDMLLEAPKPYSDNMKLRKIIERCVKKQAKDAKQRHEDEELRKWMQKNRYLRVKKGVWLNRDKEVQRGRLHNKGDRFVKKGEWVSVSYNEDKKPCFVLPAMILKDHNKRQMRGKLAMTKGKNPKNLWLDASWFSLEDVSEDGGKKCFWDQYKKAQGGKCAYYKDKLFKVLKQKK